MGRSFAISKWRWYCLVPKVALPGDPAYVICGLDDPVVMRMAGPQQALLGEAYVHGIMEYEAMAKLQRGGSSRRSGHCNWSTESLEPEPEPEPGLSLSLSLSLSLEDCSRRPCRGPRFSEMCCAAYRNSAVHILFFYILSADICKQGSKRSKAIEPNVPATRLADTGDQ